MTAEHSDQARTAQRMYNARSAKYNDSFHPKMAAEYVQWAAIRPTDQVLDLACGTGLVTLPVAKVLASAPASSRGHVLGIDVAQDMMALAQSAAVEQGFEDVTTFIQHDITQLNTLPAGTLREGGYDAITCASCLPLLESPSKAIKDWAAYLAPGGRLVADVPGQQQQVAGIVFEQALLECGEKPCWGRRWIMGMESMEKLFTDAGLDIAQSFVAKGYQSTKGEYGVDEGGEIFDEWIGGEMARDLRAKGDEFVKRARDAFERLWKERAVDGIVRDQEGFYVVVGQKPSH